MIDRAEATGFGVALAGHVALFAVLSLGFAAAKLPQVKSDPIEVAFVEEVGLETTAPTPSAEEPAPLLAPEEGPPEPAAAAPMPEPLPAPRVEPAPVPRVAPTPPPPRPAPAPKSVQRPQPPRPAPPQPKAAPPRAAPAQAKATPKAAPRANATQGQPKGTAARPTGRLNGLLAGLGARDTPSQATTPPAKKGGPAVEASLVAAVRRKVRPHWQANVPTGADAEQLRTELVITLGRNGNITGVRVAGTTGITASNRPQVALHQERARKAVTLASPFDLPDEFYENWKELAITLDLRLSQ